MEKTKLGLSVRVAGALTYLLFLFGGYTPGLLAAGYILLREEDTGLKKTAVTAVLTAVALSALNMLVGLVPDVVDVFRCLAAIFEDYINSGVIGSIANFLYAVLSLAKTVVFVGLAAMSLLGKPVKVAAVDKLLN